MRSSLWSESTVHCVDLLTPPTLALMEADPTPAFLPVVREHSAFLPILKEAKPTPLFLAVVEELSAFLLIHKD